ASSFRIWTKRYRRLRFVSDPLRSKSYLYRSNRKWWKYFRSYRTILRPTNRPTPRRLVRSNPYPIRISSDRRFAQPLPVDSRRLRPQSFSISHPSIHPFLHLDFLQQNSCNKPIRLADTSEPPPPLRWAKAELDLRLRPTHLRLCSTKSSKTTTTTTA